MEYLFGKTPLEGDIGDFAGSVHLVKVDETKWESFWNKVVQEHHSLGYGNSIGCRLKYLIAMGPRVVGAISFCSAAYKLGPRDKVIGWDELTRLDMLPHLACNNRFLIVPWIEVGNLASLALSLSLKCLREDWKRQYEVELYMVETFVDGDKFLGACYVADNWIRLGKTKGYGKQGNSFVSHGRVKGLYVKILSRRFACAFHPGVDRLRGERKELLSMIGGIPIHIDDEKFKSLGIENIDPQAMDELLADHLKAFVPYLTRQETQLHFASMVKGLLSDLDRKSMLNICGDFEGIDEYRNLANFITRSPWDEDGMHGEYKKELAGILSDPMGMITGDGCDFPKKGKMSVGVARQYCGRLGKRDNCQAGVFIGYAGRRGYGLVDYELFMPEKWFEESFKDKREKCRVPENLEFRTKNKILSAMINKEWSSGRFKGRYVGVDAGFGHDHGFLDSLPPELIYFADVPSNTRVFPERPEMILPEYSGRGKRPTKPSPSIPAKSVKEIVADESVPWNDVVIGNGSDGPMLTRDKCINVVEIRNGKPAKEVWLYARELKDKSIKYSLCNAPMDAKLEDIRIPASMRWSIEQCFLECKKHLGMDHYAVRTWHGWKRHILLTLIAHLFVTKLKNKFIVTPDVPGPVPIVDKPVEADKYAEAAMLLENGQEIDHPDIHAFPKTPQQALTIGPILKLVNGLLFRKGNFMSLIRDAIDRRYAAYQYSAKTTAAAMLKMCIPQAAS